MTLEQRVWRLERLCMGLGLALVAASVMAAQKVSPGPLIGTSLDIVDTAGNRRISASVSKDGGQILIKTAKFDAPIWIGGDDANPSITLGGAGTGGDAEITVGKADGGRIRLSKADEDWTFDTLKPAK